MFLNFLFILDGFHTLSCSTACIMKLWGDGGLCGRLLIPVCMLVVLWTKCFPENLSSGHFEL